MPHERTTLAYDEWMRRVDTVCWHLVGCSFYDLTDYPHVEAFEAGVSPVTAARHAIRDSSVES